MTTTDITLRGLKVIEDFITHDEEREILEMLKPTPKRSTTERNSIKRYGAVTYNNYMKGDIPDFLKKIAEKLVVEKHLWMIPDSISINEYQKGQVVKPHIDNAESGSVISVVSLLSEATMKMEMGNESFFVELPPRSLLQLRDEFRFSWKHSIEPVKSARYSIVFRQSTIKPNA